MLTAQSVPRTAGGSRAPRRAPRLAARATHPPRASRAVLRLPSLRPTPGDANAPPAASISRAVNGPSSRAPRAPRRSRIHRVVPPAHERVRVMASRRPAHGMPAQPVPRAERANSAARAETLNEHLFAPPTDARARAFRAASGPHARSLTVPGCTASPAPPPPRRARARAMARRRDPHRLPAESVRALAAVRAGGQARSRVSSRERNARAEPWRASHELGAVCDTAAAPPPTEFPSEGTSRRGQDSARISMIKTK